MAGSMPVRRTRGWLGATTMSSLACASAAIFLQGPEPVSARPMAGPQIAAGTPEGNKIQPAVEDSASAELFVTLQPGDTLGELLARAGVTRADAAQADTLVTQALAAPAAPGSEVAILLGKGARGGAQLLKQVTFRSGLELKLIVTRTDRGALRLMREDIAVDSTPLRFRGEAGAGLYWSMRARGVPAHVAAEYLDALSRRVDVEREVGPGDKFDLVLAHSRASTGESRTGSLLYAALDRRSGPDLQLVNWSVGGRSGWVDANSGIAQSAGLISPVAGRVTSTFGTRIHPILRFARFHGGVDFGARWGTPIVAAADGRVVGAGWNGGYGRQVRIAHSGGVETSYSHMSSIAAAPGAVVRQGQLIGHVGSTGFSTGPHLHYEIHEQGRPVDPLRARHSGSRALSRMEMAAIRARLRQLLAVGGGRPTSAQATSASS